MNVAHTFSRIRLRVGVALVCAALAALPLKTRAEDGLAAFGSAIDELRRANLISGQKMLVERMAAKACFVVAGINADSYGESMTEAHDRFLYIQSALREGNVVAGLLPETNTRVLTALDEVDTLFKPFDEVALDVAAGNADQARLGEMLAMTSSLFSSIDRLAGLVERVHASASVPRSVRVQHTYAGLQRRLTQKMIKEGCMIATLGDTRSVQAELENSIEEFESRLVALRNGKILLGLPKAEDPRLVADLDEVERLWQEIEPVLAEAVAGTAPSADDLELLVIDSTPMMEFANDAVTAIETASR